MASRTDRDSKNARNESRNEMNAKSEFAPGRSERWRHPGPRQAAWAAGRQQQARGRDKTSRAVTPSGTPPHSDFTAPTEKDTISLFFQISLWTFKLILEIWYES